MIADASARSRGVSSIASSAHYGRAKEQADDVKLIEELFLSTMSRRPTTDELVSVKKAMGAEDREESFRDLFWALLNSKEFAFNH